MTTEFLNDLSTAYVPQTCSPINRASHAVVAREVKLPATQLSCVACEGEQALAGADIPDFGRVVEGCCHQFVTVGIKVDSNDFGVVALEAE